MHIETEQLRERSIVFTHAKLTSKVITDTKANAVTILLTVNQKEDMFIGVMFGEDLKDIYKKVRERALNPPLPPLKIAKEDMEFYGWGPFMPEQKILRISSDFMKDKDFEPIDGSTDIFCDIP